MFTVLQEIHVGVVPKRELKDGEKVPEYTFIRCPGR